MDRNEMLNILNGMSERCLMRGMISTLDDAKILCEVFDRFRSNSYTNDEEYSRDIVYLYNLARKLHESGNTSLEESYSIYNAILSADSVDFVEIDDSVENHEENGLNEVEHIVEETIVKIDPIKLKKKNKKTKDDEGVVDISDIVIS